MSEQSFREIQLSGKQLVFLFMASVVAAVAIFLLGISVGRGLHPAGTAAVGTTAVDVPPEKDQTAPAVMPPPTEVTPADRAYHDELQGQTTPPPAALPSSSSAASSGVDASAAPPEPVDESATPENGAKTPAATKAAVNTPAKTPVATKAPASSSSVADAAPAAVPAGSWFVQVGAFKSRENADRLAARLKTKGYAAAVLVTSSKSVPFHVRVGPLGDRSEAQRAAARIQREEGQKPSVTH